MGAIQECVKVLTPADMIPGVTFGKVEYAAYRGRFKGSLRLPHDPSGQEYQYDMPVWIITPDNQPDGNGTVIIDPLHTAAVEGAAPGVVQPAGWTRSGLEGEMPMALKILGPRFLFRRPTPGPGGNTGNYTWLGVRWDPRALVTASPKLRYDHEYEQRPRPPADAVSPGTITPADLTTKAGSDRAVHVGHAMLAHLALAARTGRLTLKGETSDRSFATVQRLIAFGHSQTGRLLRKLLYAPPGAADGIAAELLFDGWMICGARADNERWPGSIGAPIKPEDLTWPDPTRGYVMEVGTEHDVGFTSGVIFTTGKGNEYVRFDDSVAPKHRSYEIAGAAHLAWAGPALQGRPGGAAFLPDYADSLAEQAALSGLTADLPPVRDAFYCDATGQQACTNPLDWNPVVRALTVALDAWIRQGDAAKPPPSTWLETPGGGEARGNASKKRDAVGNALGGIRLPDVHVGRGRFYAPYVPPHTGVVAITVTAGGSSYAQPPTISFSGGLGTGAKATAVVSGGVVTQIVLEDPGSGYRAAPTVVITPDAGGYGFGARAVAKLHPFPGDTDLAGGYVDLHERFETHCGRDWTKWMTDVGVHRPDLPSAAFVDPPDLPAFVVDPPDLPRAAFVDPDLPEAAFGRGNYVVRFWKQARALVKAGFLLQDDAGALTLSAIDSRVGICAPRAKPIGYVERPLPPYFWPGPEPVGTDGLDG